MPTETYTSLLTVEVGATPLPDDVAALLERARITDSSGLPTSFELDFADNEGVVLGKSAIGIGSAIRLTASTNGPDRPQPMLVGEVTALDREDVGGSLRTRIRGLDRSHRLFRGGRVVAYIDSTVADIVAVVAARAGLEAHVTSADGSVHAHIAQDGVSDWMFLTRLADESGCTFAVADGRLEFGPSTDAADAPDGEAGARDVAVVIEHGVNTLYLRSTVTSSGQVPEVEVRGWDVENKEAVVSRAAAKARSAELVGVDPLELAEKFGGPGLALAGRDGGPSARDRFATSVADRIAGGFAEVEAHILGNPAIRAGTAIAIRGFGAPFDGRYAVTESIQDFDSRLGYTTAATVSNTSDRSLYGLVSGGYGYASTGPVPGVVSAIVTDNDDPDRLGRVKLSFPTSSDDYVSAWSRTVQSGAGRGRGCVVLPEVGDEVLVAFEQGRFDRPYVIGGLYNGIDEPDRGWGAHVKNGEVVRRAFTSRTGMLIEFVEDAGDERLELSTGDGAQKITLLQSAGKGVSIVADGPVSVVAEGDVSVTTDSGRISLAAAEISINASNALDLRGTTVRMTSDATTEIGAASLELSGSVGAQLTSTGSTVVKGATVLIN